MIYLDLIKRFWPFLLAVVLFGTGFGYGHHVDHKAMLAKLEALQHDYDRFQAEVRVQGEAAQKAADERTAKDKQDKANADEDYSRTIAGLNADNQRLRDKDRARGNYLPSPPPTSTKPDQACLNRTALESAIGQLVAGFQTIANQGDTAMIELNNARLWAQNP